MKKIFRMANAELSKIFMRPSMFVLATVLVVALVLSFTFYKPNPTNTKFTYDYNFTGQRYTAFENDYKGLEAELVTSKQSIDDYLDEENDICNQFKEKFQSLKTQFYEVLYNTILEAPKNTTSPSETTLQRISQEFLTFSEQVRDIRVLMMDKIKDKYTNIFIKNSDYSDIFSRLKNLGENLPTQEQLQSFTTQQIIDRYNLINESYKLDSMNKKVQSLEKIEVNSEKLTDQLDKYFYSNIVLPIGSGEVTPEHTGKLEEMYDDIINYYTEQGSTDDKAVVNTLNDKIAKYYDYITICSTLIKNNFELLRIGDKTDDQIASYNGFSGVSVYELNNEVTTYEYFFNNNTFGYEYLRAFNFGSNSGTSTNAYDFTFYAMQILSLLITIFIIFFACGMISGEQNAGTLKMVATRPYTRNKIYSGKFLACVNVALILLGLSFVASFVVGVAVFGFTMQNVLVVVNAKSVIILNPLLLMLIYILSILVDVVFYIALAILVSMLIKQTTVSTAVTSGILLISTIIAGSVRSSWIRLIPSLNTGLYKFFTSSVTGMFSFSVVPNVTMVFSVLMLIISITAFDILGRLLFTHRSIDK